MRAMPRPCCARPPRSALTTLRPSARRCRWPRRRARARSTTGTRVKLFWQPAAGHDDGTAYVVTRFEQRPPAAPGDGSVVYRGPAVSCADTHAPVASRAQLRHLRRHRRTPRFAARRGDRHPAATGLAPGGRDRPVGNHGSLGRAPEPRRRSGLPAPPGSTADPGSGHREQLSADRSARGAGPALRGHGRLPRPERRGACSPPPRRSTPRRCRRPSRSPGCGPSSSRSGVRSGCACPGSPSTSPRFASCVPTPCRAGRSGRGSSRRTWPGSARRCPAPDRLGCRDDRRGRAVARSASPHAVLGRRYRHRRWDVLRWSASSTRCGVWWSRLSRPTPPCPGSGRPPPSSPS